MGLNAGLGPSKKSHHKTPYSTNVPLHPLVRRLKVKVSCRFACEATYDRVGMRLLGFDNGATTSGLRGVIRGRVSWQRKPPSSLLWLGALRAWLPGSSKFRSAIRTKRGTERRRLPAFHLRGADFLTSFVLASGEFRSRSVELIAL